MNNTKLLYLFLALVALWLVLQVSSWGKTDRTLPAALVDLDTAAVDAISLYPRAENGAEIRFARTDTGWTVTHAGRTAEADPAAVNRLMGQLHTLKPRRLAGKTPDAWAGFQVTDSTGTRVQMETNGRTALDLWLGRFSFQQATRATTTYVRREGEDEVYAVDGFLSMGVNQGFNAWRNRTVVYLEPEHLSRLAFTYPADSGFVLTREPDGWHLGGARADSAAMAGYLNTLRTLSNDRFADATPAPSGPAEFQLLIEGNNMVPIRIQGFKQDTAYVVHSSLNPAAYFESDAGGLFGTLFKGASQFTGMR